MKLHDQVVSLELAKRLKELGVKQDGYFCWFKLRESDDLPLSWSLSEEWQVDDLERFDEISAFTVAELGEMLPVCTPYTIVRSLINTYIFSSYPKYPPFEDKSDANCRAKMLIYLLENGLIKL